MVQKVWQVILIALVIVGLVLPNPQVLFAKSTDQKDTKKEAEVTNNEATMPASSEEEDVYVRTIVPLSQNEAETYSALSKESPALANLNAGKDDAVLGKDLLIALACICLILILISASQAGRDNEEDE
ncbi:unnamed protein product [marine sediment metagenome]|uniref:Uncharacterized protein n=1 Tax=marine sediment metagenome TaxID=412755 RepID=X0REE5_9ZZZZ